MPIYIQEKVHPQAIIDDFRRSIAREPDPQKDFWSDFNGLPDDFHDRVDFYHHEANWQNRLILGNSLLVMTSLAEKENLKGQVQMIYMDPPYGIKFGSNWQVSTRKRDVKDGKAEDACRQPEQVQAFRDTWKLGIHSYLPYLRDRLVTARELLTESGSIFVQIGDENVHLVRCVLDEVFGVENFCAAIVFAKTSSSSSEALSSVADYILWYAKEKGAVKYRQLYNAKIISESIEGSYDCVELPSQNWRRMNRQEKDDPAKVPEGSRVFMAGALTSSRPVGQGDVTQFEFEGHRFGPGSGTFKTTALGLGRLARGGRLVNVNGNLRYRRLFTDFPYSPRANIWTDTTTGTYTDPKVYVVQTGARTVERCLLMATDPGDLVLDPTCGSGTTAYVAEQWGRRWITVDTSRVALTLARTRLMAGRFPYYLLADTPEGRKKEAELTGSLTALTPGPSPAAEYSGGRGETGDIRKGFVYKRVPHVTLKAIANNEEIDAIHAKWQAQLEPLLAKVNKALAKDWQEWEVQREIESGDKSPHSKDGAKTASRVVGPSPSPPEGD